MNERNNRRPPAPSSQNYNNLLLQGDPFSPYEQSTFNERNMENTYQHTQTLQKKSYLSKESDPDVPEERSSRDSVMPKNHQMPFQNRSATYRQSHLDSSSPTKIKIANALSITPYNEYDSSLPSKNHLSPERRGGETSREGLHGNEDIIREILRYEQKVSVVSTHTQYIDRDKDSIYKQYIELHDRYVSLLHIQTCISSLLLF